MATKSKSKSKSRPKPKKKAVPRAAAKRAVRKPVARARKGTPKSAAARPKRQQPENFRARGLTPGFTVSDLPRSIRFYCDGLGFHMGERWEAGGELRGVSLKAGACELMLGQDDFAKGRDRVKGVGCRFWVFTAQDVDAVAARAKSKNITLDAEPAMLDWGVRAFAVTDPDGFKLTIAQSNPV